jgi:arylsulfatase
VGAIKDGQRYAIWGRTDQVLKRALVNIASALGAIGLAVALWAAATADGAPEPAPGGGDVGFGTPKHIILITVDTLRADRLGVYGHEGAVTPNIDRLGRQGIVFRQVTVPIPRTTPGLASLMTGLGPRDHGSTEVGETMKDVPTLAEALHEAGFQTFGVSANGAAGRGQGFARGFDEFVGREYRKTDRQALGKVGAVVSSRVKGYLEAADLSRPVFIWAHYVDPHWEYEPPHWYEEQPKAQKCRDLDAQIGKRTLTRGMVFVDAGGVASDALEDCSALYDAEVAYTDIQVGKILGFLEDFEIEDETLVVLTADHGENLGEDGYFYDHGPSLNDASLVVPLVVSGVGAARGRVDSAVTRIEDVAPTVLELAGVPRDAWPQMDGRSFAWRWDRGFEIPQVRAELTLAESASALLPEATTFVVSGRHGGKWCVNEARWSRCMAGRGEPRYYDHVADPQLRVATQPPAEIAEALTRAAQEWGPEEARSRCARTPKFKLVQYPQLDGSFREALYDLQADPRETQDVTQTHPKVAAKLRSALRDWSAQGVVRVKQRSDEDLQTLRSLGYVE